MQSGCSLAGQVSNLMTKLDRVIFRCKLFQYFFCKVGEAAYVFSKLAPILDPKGGALFCFSMGFDWVTLYGLPFGAPFGGCALIWAGTLTEHGHFIRGSFGELCLQAPLSPSNMPIFWEFSATKKGVFLGAFCGHFSGFFILLDKPCSFAVLL